ncbi:hypothetical protein ATE47_01300 [Chryseobacterium sp. IHB B 17019]|uniref:DUF6520 family protein n=1 Tax=Chryseobacterium sp. IHB B 17019 TaxID=1721091 RepID=UPI000721645B|nr:DUF6520 family protein [Chryseobacterium sp. IHB B 17019]ALR29248.1 hypothetical protein ATE47_01300 [Chryseobacterium sp. IHB B 17019]
MKKLIFPVAVILIGAGAAFATKATTSKNALVDAYRINAVTGRCISAEQQCSTLGSETCTWTADGVTPLHDEPISSTMCGEELFKVN